MLAITIFIIGSYVYINSTVLLTFKSKDWRIPFDVNYLRSLRVTIANVAGFITDKDSKIRLHVYLNTFSYVQIY